MNQCDRVIECILKNGSITDNDARDMKIHRLSARIHDLRKQNWNIVTDTIHGKNEYGYWHCASYRLGE